MGLFGFIGSIGSSLSSGISKIASAISSGVTSFAKTAFKAATGIFTSVGSVGGFVGKVATVAGKIFSGTGSIMAGPLGPIVGQVVTNLVIAAVSKAAQWLAQKTAIIGSEDTVEEVGYRVEEASKHDDWKRREEFDSFAAYHAYLKTQIPVENINRNKIEENRLAYMGLGLSALNSGLEEKFGSKIPVEFLIEIGRGKLDGKEFGSLLEEFSAKGYDLTLFRKYLRDGLDGNTSRLIEETIMSALKKVYPEKSAEELTAGLSALKKFSRDDNAVLENFAPEVKKLEAGKENFQRILFGEAMTNVNMDESRKKFE